MDSDTDSQQDQGVRSLLIQSLEFVAFNARSYGFSRLAWLPRNLRTHILRLMRLIELCNLRETDPLCADISVKDSVWFYVGERLITLGDPLCIKIPLRDLEDMFYAVGDSRLTWVETEWTREQVQVAKEFTRERYLNAIVSCLFSSQEMLRDAAISALYRTGVSHYESLITISDTRQDEELLEGFLSECHYFPSVVYIDCADLLHSGLWARRKTAFSCVRRALCRVKQLTLSLTGPWRHSNRVSSNNKKTVVQIFRFILEAVFTRGGRLGDCDAIPSITHLSVKGDIESLAKAVDHLSDFLTNRSSAIPTFTDSHLICHYSGLQFISIELGCNGLGSDIGLMNRFHASLRHILTHQKSLRKLCLVGWSTSVPPAARSEYEGLIDCIRRLFRKSYFRALHLEIQLYRNNDGHEINLKSILHEFLSSPLKEQAFKLYCVAGDCLDHCGNFCRQSFSNVCTSNEMPITNKHLHVIDQSVSQWFDHFLTRCLLEHSAYQHLSHLSLEGTEDISDDTLMGLKALRLKSFVISSPDNDLMSGISIEALVDVFSMPFLEELTLFNVVVGNHLLMDMNPKSPSRLTQAVMRGMWKQATIGKLVRLDISRNCLGRGKFEYLQELFQALFAFKQLSRTTVFLHDNLFKRQHFELMCMAWQLNASNSKLLQLGASNIGTDTQTYLTCRKLNSVAYVIT